MPPDFLGSTASLTGTQVTFNGNDVTFRGTGSATMPTTLMAVLGFDEVPLASTCQIYRRGIDLAFVMHAGGSGYAASVADQIRGQQRLFVRGLNPVDDRLALVEFSTGAAVFEPIRTIARGIDLNRVIGHIEPHLRPFSESIIIVGTEKYINTGMDGFSNNGEGLWQARDQLNKVAAASRSTVRAIVLYSHFMPTAFSSQFIFTDSKNA